MGFKSLGGDKMLRVLILWLCCFCSLSSSLRIIGIEERRTDQLLHNNGMQCNNTIQGRDLLSDSHGYVCSIMAIDPATACCPEAGEKYSCLGCNMSSQCCNAYEYCVSCCLNPSRTALDVALRTKLAKQSTSGTCTSLFDYCKGRCRHNSESVVHENAYVSGDHHCFSAKSNPIGGPSEASAEVALADVSILVGRQGQACDAACYERRLSCKEEKLASINTCAELQKFNKCKGLCIPSSGPDQPAEVVSTAPKHLNPGACLYNTQVSQLSCKGSHPYTRRLCPCA